MIKNKTIKLIFIVFSVGLISSCANLKAVQDFGTASKTFGTSYDEVYFGAYKTCLGSRELNHTKAQVLKLEGVNPESQIRVDEMFCERWKKFADVYRESALALADFGTALETLASKGNMDFQKQFTEITQNLGSISPKLKLQEANVEKINLIAQILLRSYIKGQAAELIRDSEEEVTATLELLSVLSEIYTEQLNTYKGNINDINKLAEKLKNSDTALVLQLLVRNNLSKYSKREEILGNYETGLNDVKEAYSQILERAKFTKPNFDDPVFQREMQEFLIKIIKLVQGSKALTS
jgi:hypothetical protein